MRFSRGQKFMLTTTGVAAEAGYRAAVITSRGTEGRGSFDDTLASWGNALRVRGEDGPYLSELTAGPISFKALLDAFEGCGRSADETKSALERLVTAGLVVSDGDI